ncbi:SWIM zinc finger family protein [Streptomyces marispadix]|uniref:SWIM zinc finger family protein n=1 Tax=Streptomyces marispadix TaxID=2922868 RepID=A0ABS9T0V4_9ACTN|nr:SWIM zinc finger family protein [Streptomyces marispadix]MCH6162147.1 SWIM zinc finger family protein [Streptomyces marispadix]
MDGPGVRWKAEEVLALAPDDASRRAGSKLSSPGPWSEAGSGDGAVWGLCEGSGSRPYRTVVDLGGPHGGSADVPGDGPGEGPGDGPGDGPVGDPGQDKGYGRGHGPGYKCSCPSRKFPCKHALGLLLLWAGERETGSPQVVRSGGRPPEWANEWLAGRRERAARRAAGGRPGRAGGDSADEADAGAGSGGARGPADPEAARRRAQRRMRRITAGATELEERLADMLRAGLAGAEQGGYGQWEETASRMVDAQAPGLAARIRELGAVPVSGRTSSPAGDAAGGWPGRLLSECALLHLLNRGVLALDSLPEPLAATVRTRVGLTVDSAELLAGGAEKVRDEWLVLAQRDTEEGRLTARRIWLKGLASGRPALLLSYAAGGRAPEQALPVGSSIDAELAYHPGARPLRAVLGESHGTPSAAGHVPEGGTVTDSLASYGQALCDDPWLDAWPAVLSDVVPVLGEYGDGTAAGHGDGTGGGSESAAHGSPGVRQLADAGGEFALPVAPGVSPASLWRLTAVSGGRPVTVFGECGHRGFAPYTVWSEGEAVPL